MQKNNQGNLGRMAPAQQRGRKSPGFRPQARRSQPQAPKSEISPQVHVKYASLTRMQLGIG